MTAIEVTASVGGGVPQAGQRQDERAAGAQPDRVGGRPGPRVDPGPEPRAGQRAVAGERVDIREFAVTDAMPQKNWATAQMSSRNMPTRAPGRVDEDLGRRQPGRGCRASAVVVLDREGDAEQQHPAGDDRDPDDRARCPWARRGGVVRLLGHVRGGVVPGVGVLGHQQADQDDVDRAGPAGRRCANSVNVHDSDWCWSGTNARARDDDRDADEVPPGADVGEQRDQVDAERVEQRRAAA